MVYLCSLPAYAQQPKWSLHNSEVDYLGNTTAPLPNGQSPEYTQNALWDNNGNLVFYEADGIVYNNQGNVLLQFERINSSGILKPIKGFTEFLIFPVPGECNQFYGVISYSERGSQGSNFDAVYWCRLQVDFNSNTTTVLPVNANGDEIGVISVECESTERSDGGGDQEENFNYFTHLEVSQLQNNNKRKVFCITPTCLVTLEADNLGLEFLDGLQYVSNNSTYHFLPTSNLRTELEVFEISDGMFNIVTPYYGTNFLQSVNKFSVFTVDYTVSPIQYSQENYPLMNDENRRIQKGVEFSEDGLTLYLSHVKTLWSAFGTQGYSAIPNGAHVVYFSRPSLSSPFSYGGTLLTGSDNADFAYGMIEKGRDQALYLVGNGRLARLNDSNDPNSFLNSNYMSINNNISNAPDYATSGSNSPTTLDYIHRELYLMVDQVDNENTDPWSDISQVDQWPQTIQTCSSTTTVNSQFTGDWIWLPNMLPSFFSIEDPCEIPAYFFYDPKFNPLVFGSSTTVTVSGSGTLLQFYGGEECCFYEEVYIDAVELEPSTFSWVFVNDGASVNLELTANTQPAHLNYNWTIEEWDNTTSSWVPFQSVNNHGAVWNVSGLNILTDYRISLSVNLQPWAAQCVTWASPPTEINTGGRVGTESGVSEKPIMNEF